MSTITVREGDDLQAAMQQSVGGDTLALQAGVTFRGTFAPPPRDIPVRVTSTAALPDRRIAVEDDALLPRIESPSADPAIVAHQTRNWIFDGVRLMPTREGLYNVVWVERASRIEFDRVLFLGGTYGQRRVILGNGADISVRRSHFSNVFRIGDESNAFCAYSGAGPYTIQNNYFEVAGINILFGGSNSATSADVPANILVEGNHCTKRLSWRNVATVKNLFELKQAKRALIRHNVFEHNWTDAQNGFGILFTVRNDDGGAPWAVVEDIVFEQNIVRGTEHAFNILGYDSYQASGRATGITIRHNTIETPGRFLQIGGEVGHLTVTNNQVQNGDFAMMLYAGDVWPAPEGLTQPRPARFAAERLVYADNVLANAEPFGDGVGPGPVALATFVKEFVTTPPPTDPTDPPNPLPVDPIPALVHRIEGIEAKLAAILAYLGKAPTTNSVKALATYIRNVPKV